MTFDIMGCSVKESLFFFFFFQFYDASNIELNINNIVNELCRDSVKINRNFKLSAKVGEICCSSSLF